MTTMKDLAIILENRSGASTTASQPTASATW